MPAFFVALRESVHDPKEMRLYADKAAGSAAGHPLVIRVAYGRLRMTEGALIEGAVVLEFPTFEEAEAWYHNAAYQEAVVHRFRGAKYRTFIVQGSSEDQAVESRLPHDQIVASAAPSSASRLRFLIGNVTIAVAIYVPTAATGAALKQANSSPLST